MDLCDMLFGVDFDSYLTMPCGSTRQMPLSDIGLARRRHCADLPHHAHASPCRLVPSRHTAFIRDLDELAQFS